MRFVFPSLLLLLLLPVGLWAQVHDVLAHASPQRVWIAKVTTQSGVADTTEQTDILVRQHGPGERWQPMATIPARIIALACNRSQLVVLQSNGDWKLTWSSDGGSSGQPLPGGGRIRAIGDDGDSLWAVGSVRGGLRAATEPAASLPPPSTQPNLPYKLVLFKQDAGQWNALAELSPEPDPSVSLVGDISLSFVGLQPVVAFQLSDGSVRVVRLHEDRSWETLDVVSPLAGEKIIDFQLVNAGAGALLWTTNGKSIGEIYRTDDPKFPPVELKWIGENAPESLPAITAFGGYLRVVGLHGGRIYEQRYDPDGTPVDTAAELTVPTALSDSPLKEYLNAALIAALTFSVIATLYRRAMQRRRTTELTPPPPAPLLPRAAAGFIDMLPFLLTVAVVTARQDKSLDPQQRLEDLPAIIATSISIGVYLLHTTLSEVFARRTLGKWLFGLQVVTVDGTKPNFIQLIIRNILRVLDLLWFPLILVVISPLRQRSADIAAGTMVVRREVALQSPLEKEATAGENILK